MKLRSYLLFVCFAAGAAVCRAEPLVSEPSIVPKIRKACTSIDSRLVTWRTIQGKQSCQGQTCDQMTIHAEGTGRIRKIEQHTYFGGPDNTASLGNSEYLYYMDEKEVPIYYYSKNIIHKQPGDAGLVSEIRYYFDNGQVAAYQKDNRWMSPADPHWPMTTGNSRHLIELQLNRAHQEISNVKLYHANE